MLWGFYPYSNSNGENSIEACGTSCPENNRSSNQLSQFWVSLYTNVQIIFFWELCCTIHLTTTQSDALVHPRLLACWGPYQFFQNGPWSIGVGTMVLLGWPTDSQADGPWDGLLSYLDLNPQPWDYDEPHETFSWGSMVQTTGSLP